jgi:hypothetical protein
LKTSADDGVRDDNDRVLFGLVEVETGSFYTMYCEIELGLLDRNCLVVDRSSSEPCNEEDSLSGLLLLYSERERSQSNNSEDSWQWGETGTAHAVDQFSSS